MLRTLEDYYICIVSRNIINEGILSFGGVRMNFNGYLPGDCFLFSFVLAFCNVKFGAFEALLLFVSLKKVLAFIVLLPRCRSFPGFFSLIFLGVISIRTVLSMQSDAA